MWRHRRKKGTTFSGSHSSKDFPFAGIPELNALSYNSNVVSPNLTSPLYPSVSGSQVNVSNEVIIINDEDDITASEDLNTSENSNFEYLGFLSGMIVGIRYYTGMVSNNEMISLDREPQNPYDCNAVRVSNARGEKVGHIKKEMARALAKIVDPGLAQMEGVVLKRGGSSFTIPVVISILGDPQNLENIAAELRKYGYKLQTTHYSNSFKSGPSTPYSQPILSKTTKLTSSQIKNHLDNLFENLKEFDQNAEAKQPKVIKSKLFRHQLQAVSWMIKREEGLDLPPFWEKITSKDGTVSYKNTILNFQTKEEPKRVKGGILADDMGLGKTLVVISLIVEHGKNNKSLFKLKEEIDKKYPVKKLNESNTFKAVKSLKKQKENDAEVQIIEDKCTNRSRKRPVKYTEDQCSDNDIEIIETVKTKKAKCKSKIRKKLEDDHCFIIEESSSLSSNFDDFQFKKESTQPTLIVCPLSVISNWEGQIKEHLHHSVELNVVIYHGVTKISAPKLSQQDIVITTYQTLAQQFKKSKKAGALLKVDWLRVVLDEGHIIRNPTALQTQACCAVKSERKWILSGTPIQNSIKDLWTMFSFLGLEPFADRSWWQRTIERPLKNGEEAALRRVQCLMGVMCLRRTKHQKIDGKPIVDLPEKEVCMTTIDLLPSERLVYNKMDAAGRKTIKSLIDNGVVMKRYAEVLVILMRLRQICCHPYLAKDAIEQLKSDVKVPADEARELVSKLVELLSSGSVEECCVCLDSLTVPVITRCAHIFCKPCISEVILNSQFHPRCPLCRGDVKQDELIEVPQEDNKDEVKGEEVMNPSTKIVALMTELTKIKEKNSKIKSLVVSQFTSFLKIIEKHLKKANIECVMFFGGLSMAKRKEAIHDFQNGSHTVMLLSLKAGGVGLNLTAASRVFLMEPAWNPAAEEQCFDRVHRLGQTKPVRIVKFVCSNSIEERIIEIQKLKQEVASKSLQKINSEQRKKQTLNDLRTLINL